VLRRPPSFHYNRRIMRPGKFVLIVIAAALFSSCGARPSAADLDADNPVTPTPPPPFGMEEFFATGHQPDPGRARLGRWLFYDTRLSSDGSVSCATCHQPEFAFSEPRAVATGIGGRQGRRKTPSIVNLAARTILPGIPDPGTTFFWDGRATSLESQVLAPISDPREMGNPHPAMITTLSAIDGYRMYFAEAFGSPEITTERVAAALAEFVRTRRSGNAPYDRWSYGGEAKAMSREAQRGLDIFSFRGGCGSCHAGFNFSDGNFWNIGVGWDPKTQSFGDVGREAVTNRATQRGAFKTPGLREVDLHPPYMHDGSLATLRDVVEYYNRGGNKNPFLTPRLRPLGLSQADIDAVVAFLKTLNGEGYQDRPPKHFPQ
jgi:cytochrome c peroxidase